MSNRTISDEEISNGNEGDINRDNDNGTDNDNDNDNDNYSEDDEDEDDEDDDVDDDESELDSPTAATYSSQHRPSAGSPYTGTDSFTGGAGYIPNMPIKIPDSSNILIVEPKVKEMINYMLRYSFGKALNNNLHWIGLIYHSFGSIIDFIGNKPKEKITMRNILKAISPLVGQNLITINRKKEEILSFEAAIVLAYMKSEYCKPLHMTMDEFAVKYPTFFAPEISEEERNRLYEFCNCVRVIQCLIPAKNNKEHILDLVSRLTEGFAVRRVTGTGMTVETRNRYDIIHKEGGLIPRQRVDRAAERAAREAENEHLPKKKRGRPLSQRTDEPLKKKYSMNDKLLLLLQAGIVAGPDSSASGVTPAPVGPASNNSSNN
jgi:hypothetical protein